MHSTTILKVLLAAVAASDMVEATIRIKHFADKRQEDNLSILPSLAGGDSGSVPSVTSPTSPATTQSSDNGSSKQSETSSVVAQITTTSDTSTSISSTPAPTTTSVSVASTQTTESSPIPTETSAAPTWTSVDTKQTTTYSQVVSTSVAVVTVTNGDGSKSTKTTSTLTTSTPGLNGDGQDEGGMPVKTRNTIIGVVVGIGGAIILGGLALVAWRIWGRKRQSEENEAFMAYGNDGYTGLDKAEASSPATGPRRSPFQSTLENYHQPTAGPVNASSNF